METLELGLDDKTEVLDRSIILVPKDGCNSASAKGTFVSSDIGTGDSDYGEWKILKSGRCNQSILKTSVKYD